MSDQEIIQSIVQECDHSFAANDVTGYARVKEMLSELKEQTPETEKALRLAEAGPELSSDRFAYPHIKSALTE
ncbi:hypothetical protein [Sulfitobacter sp. R18_1]|uniref:hypothetical protein n=1 Tax=Sulfitobacter sp. R18_1 TaxID=2821104 RepID=UPI001ADB99D2|nr:hypothetical protein [Sulfitobacter sp. R18_1]MBO9428224.1 hypothetical protein [Sulfitobacter sp. R18_1]